MDYELFELELSRARHPRITQFLKDIIFQKRLEVVFLSEIINNKEKMDQVRSILL